MASRDDIQLTHNGETISLTLPTKIAADTDLSFCFPITPQLSAVTRLQSQDSQAPDTDEELIPWSATTLGNEVEARCVGSVNGALCEAVLIERGHITQWKDLPSEGWAEMMDLWHCHKPSETHKHDDSKVEKGYAASNRLIAQSGVGLVNEMAFLVLRNDCSNMTVSPNLFVMVSYRPIQSAPMNSRSIAGP